MAKSNEQLGKPIAAKDRRGYAYTFSGLARRHAGARKGGQRSAANPAFHLSRPLTPGACKDIRSPL